MAVFENFKLLYKLAKMSLKQTKKVFYYSNFNHARSLINGKTLKNGTRQNNENMMKVLFETIELILEKISYSI